MFPDPEKCLSFERTQYRPLIPKKFFFVLTTGISSTFKFFARFYLLFSFSVLFFALYFIKATMVTAQEKGAKSDGDKGKAKGGAKRHGKVTFLFDCF
jgi:hypothetical protein